MGVRIATSGYRSLYATLAQLEVQLICNQKVGVQVRHVAPGPLNRQNELRMKPCHLADMKFSRFLMKPPVLLLHTGEFSYDQATVTATNMVAFFVDKYICLRRYTAGGYIWSFERHIDLGRWYDGCTL